jgi:hypothetical protein
VSKPGVTSASDLAPKLLLYGLVRGGSGRV